MIIKTIVVGPLQVNCYVIVDPASLQALVFDPGDEPDMITNYIERSKLKVSGIVCTHGHFDHIGAAGDINKATGAPIMLHEEDLGLYSAAKDMARYFGLGLDAPPKPDRFLAEGDDIALGALSFKVLHTPGHSPGGITLLCEGVAVTGDTLFAGSIGRTDLPGGDMELLKQSFRRILSLPEPTKILPGHGPETSVARERRDNPFMSFFDSRE